MELIPTCGMPAKQQGLVFPTFSSPSVGLGMPSKLLVLNLLSRSHPRKGPGDCPGMGEWLGEKAASVFHTVELYSNERGSLSPVWLPP